MRARGIPENKALAIVRDYKCGMTQAEVAAKHNVSTSSVGNVLARAGVKCRKRNFYREVPEDEAESMVAAYQAGKSQNEVAREHGRSQFAVYSALKRKGEGTRLKRVSKKDRQCIVSRHKSGASTAELAQEFSVWQTTVRYILNDAGIELSRRKWCFDESFFQRRDHTTAYWMGFLMADGSLMRNGGSWRLVLSIHQKDLSHLEAFCDDVGVPRSAINKHDRKQQSGSVSPMATAALHHPSLADWLLPWGIVPRKTYNFVAPSIPKRLYPPYLRGWFDGDGSIHAPKSYSGFHAVLINHEKNAIEWYCEALRRIEYDGRIAIHVQTKGKSKNWTLQISRRQDIRKFSDVLRASQSPCLLRKWSKVLSLPADYFERVEITEELIARFEELYKSGMSSREIADECGVGETTVYTHLVDRGVKIRNPWTPKKVQTQMLRLYGRGRTQAEIADEFGVSRATVRNTLKRHGIELRPHMISAEVGEKMAAAYKGGKSLNAVAKTFGCSWTGARSAIERAGVEIREK